MRRMLFLVFVLSALAALSCAPETGQQASGGGGQTPAPAQSQPTPTPQGPQRIVTAAPGAVAEAEGVRVTLHEIRDPFVSNNPFAQAPQGKRFVAFDVTVERTRSPGHYASCGSFKLVDQGGFVSDFSGGALGAVMADNLPVLSGAQIGEGEKVRGWCGFEMGAGARLAVLKYDPNPVTTSDIEFRFQ